MDADTLDQMRQLSRQYIRTVWEISGLDEGQLSEEDRVLLEVMRQHPQYYDLWGRLDEVSDKELQRDGSDPVVHLTIHQTVENQISLGQPPETARTLTRLMDQGETRHNAIHLIGSVLAEEIFEILNQARVFDETRYVEKLRRLKASPKKSQ